MQGTNASRNRKVMVALMGPTGTGKSTLINLLTNDDNIRIGHDLESETFDVNTSLYSEAGLSVTLVDTPGFDDSHEGVTDTDILGKTAGFLQEDGGRKLNGIIYLHRISDPRMGGAAKKNLRMFREICGDENLGHVRIVTTNWNRVNEKEGGARQTALAKGAFKPLIDAGAKLCRHDKGLESARSIMSQLIHQTPVTMKIQKELNAGRALGDTSAGAVIIEEMKELQKKHDKEMEGLKKELEEAAMANDEELRAELAGERRKLEEMMARAEEDRKTLEKTRTARETRSKSNAGKKEAADERVVMVRPANSDLDYLRSVEEAAMRATVVAPAGSAIPPSQRDSLSQMRGNDQAERGSRLEQFLHDMAEVIGECSQAGGESLGSFGVVVGGLIGLWLSPFIAAKRAIFRP